MHKGLSKAILSGTLLPGTRLPSTRALASELRVSRNTIVNAFRQLVAEGYCEAHVGAGTFVTRSLPDDLLKVRRQAGRASAAPSAPPRPAARRDALSRRGRVVSELTVSAMDEPGRPGAFRPGVPALDAFPIETWSRLAARHWRSIPPEALAYGDSAGYRPLRETVASYLQTARGVRCSADQVLIVSGTQQALLLAVRILLNPGDTAWIEDPGYPRAQGALRAAGARCTPVPVDDEGLDLDAGTRREPRARLAYVTPSHQYPLGVTMSLARRLELLDWADRAEAWILEDDYDSEYRYEGRPLAALQGLDQMGRVIYTGTFSKALFPALRLGYMVVPPDLIGLFVTARSLSDRCSPQVSQMTLTDFIAEGHFEQHIRRMRTLYAARQAALVHAAREHLSDYLDVRPAEAGLHLVGWLPDAVDDRAVSSRIGQYGVVAPPLSFYATDSLQRGGLVLGYASTGKEQIHAGVAAMKAAFASLD